MLPNSLSGHNHGFADGFKVLLAESSADYAYDVVEALSQSQDVFHIEHREGLADALEALEQSYFDVVLLSVSCLSSSVEGGLLRIVSLRPQASVVLICDEYQQETAFAGVRAGAHDYLVRGNDESDVILRTVRSALQRHSSATRLHYMAHHDSLTGLANRSLFEKCLRDAMDRPDPGPGVVYLDLDGFKPINDTHGHDAGDEVLRVVARRLRNVVRGLDVVARIGGDEFAVMVEGMRSIDEGAEIAERLLRRVSAPIAFGNLELTVGCSAGVALACPEVSNPEQLVQCADQAMYRAKNAGRGRVRVHRPEHTDTSTRTTPSVTSTLQGALERDEYRLYFQPQVDATGSLFGVEALLRWQSGSELVAPGDFIPMLEENGAIVQVGRWVLRRALGQLRQWWSQGVSVPRMAVNISPVQLETPDLCDVVTDALRTFGIPPSALELEVTERVVMSNHAACSTNIERIRASGVRLALDDFGTGYASLAYLHRYPMDTLKVDQSFVQDVTTNAKSASIVGSIIDLGRRLNLVTIAEGVETTAQAEFLRREGCAVLQGYLYDRPRPGNVAPLSDTTLNSPTIA